MPNNLLNKFSNKPSELQWDYRREQHYVPESAHELQKPDDYTKRRLEYLKQKFNVDGLAVKGLASQPSKETLADATERVERDLMKGWKLATASVQHKGQPVRLWYSITK